MPSFNGFVDDRYLVYSGIPNEFATKLILTLMGFMLTLILICLFLILIVRTYYKSKDEQHISHEKDGPVTVKVEKARSPYVITPEQKITQQLLASQIVTPIECSVNDIAQVLHYMALNGKFAHDQIYLAPRTLVRLVPRRKTKFDQDSSKEQEIELKSELKPEKKSSKCAKSAAKKQKKKSSKGEGNFIFQTGKDEENEKSDNIKDKEMQSKKSAEAENKKGLRSRRKRAKSRSKRAKEKPPAKKSKKKSVRKHKKSGKSKSRKKDKLQRKRKTRKGGKLSKKFEEHKNKKTDE